MRLVDRHPLGLTGAGLGKLFTFGGSSLLGLYREAIRWISVT